MAARRRARPRALARALARSSLISRSARMRRWAARAAACFLAARSAARWRAARALAAARARARARSRAEAMSARRLLLARSFLREPMARLCAAQTFFNAAMSLALAAARRATRPRAAPTAFLCAASKACARALSAARRAARARAPCSFLACARARAKAFLCFWARLRILARSTARALARARAAAAAALAAAAAAAAPWDGLRDRAFCRGIAGRAEGGMACCDARCWRGCCWARTCAEDIVTGGGGPAISTRRCCLLGKASIGNGSKIWSEFGMLICFWTMRDFCKAASWLNIKNCSLARSRILWCAENAGFSASTCWCTARGVT
mmetsp:Transcript_13381/g.31674  ORF Transcript_13381/g.31674 Transcript_13381/m.31674 type:complete len:324 (-) Transcript_13381:256-1227(-)